LQYADTEDATNFVGNRVRRYRHSLAVLANAVRFFDELGNVAVAVQLGDMLDGKANEGGKASSRAALKDVRDVLVEGRLGRTAGGWRSCVGNHELYNFDRWELAAEDLYFEGNPQENVQRILEERAACEEAAAPGRPSFDAEDVSPPLYYSTKPKPGWRLVFLDSYAESIIGDARGAWGRDASARRLNKQNPNIDIEDPTKSFDWTRGLEGDRLRWVPYNGALGTTQLAWLATELAEAKAAAERVIIFCHQPFFIGATRNNNLPWDYEELQGVVAAEPDVVAVVFAGHDHDGGYGVDAGGVHHLVPAAPLECAEGEMAYGYLDCYLDRLEMHWVGKVPNKGAEWPEVLPLAPLPLQGAARL